MSLKRIVVAILLIVSLLPRPNARSAKLNTMSSYRSTIQRCVSSCRSPRGTWAQTDGCSTASPIANYTPLSMPTNKSRYSSFTGYSSKAIFRASLICTTLDSPTHATIGGMDFYVDTWVRGNDEKFDVGSDREHIDITIRNKGYSMPTGKTYARLVHPLDDQKRKELMIIYGEDLAPTGSPLPTSKRTAKLTTNGRPCRRACSNTPKTGSRSIRSQNLSHPRGDCLRNATIPSYDLPNLRLRSGVP